MGQRRVSDKSNEIPALPDLLEPLDLDGALITADAMHTQRSTAQWIISRGAHYVLTVKNNQPGLKRALKKLPWKDVPAVSSVDTGHGRRVRRTVQAVEAPAWIDFPGAAQVIRIRRTTTHSAPFLPAAPIPAPEPPVLVRKAHSAQNKFSPKTLC